MIRKKLIRKLHNSLQLFFISHMKFILIFVSLFILTSCAKWETSLTQAPVPTPKPTETINTGTYWGPVVDPISPTSTSAPQTSYYDELRNRCREQSEEKRSWCNASVVIMERGGYKEVGYDTERNTLPCPDGMVKDTIRSPGSLTWCKNPAQ